MRVSLNPINTNTKSSVCANSNQVNFKARAELRLSDVFFTKLGELKPDKAAIKVQNVIDAITFLKRVAPKIGKRDELAILTDQCVADDRLVDLFYFRRFGGNPVRGEKRLYKKEWITPVLVDDGSRPVLQMTNIFNDKFTAEKGIVLKDKKKLPKPVEPTTWYGHFVASRDGSALERRKYTYAGFSAEVLAKRNTDPKVLSTETTTLAELTAKLKALCTPVEEQRQLSYCGFDK